MDKLKKSTLFYITCNLLAVATFIFVCTKITFVFEPVVIFVSTLFAPVLVAGFLYYACEPLVRLLETKANYTRKWSIFAVMGLLFGVLALSMSKIIPTVTIQLGDLIERLPELGKKVQETSQELIGQRWLKDLHLQTQVSAYSKELESLAKSSLLGITTSIGALFSAVTNILLVVVTAPLILLYMLKDGEKFPQAVSELAPERYREDVVALMQEMNQTVARYISGQSLVCLFVGTFTFIGYWILGLDYALTLGVFAAITNIIPYLGPYIGLIPAVIIGFSDSFLMGLLPCIIVLVVQQIDSNFISPNVLGKTLNMHPLTIMFLLLVVGKLGGVVGMILAVPGYAVMKTVLLHPMKRKKMPEQVTSE